MMKVPSKIPVPLVGRQKIAEGPLHEVAKEPLTLVIITLNEEKNIERCIRSVPFAKQVIVVDSFSQDGTTALALGLGAQVIERKFEGYRDQKQFAVEQATEPWVLSLDADEELSEGLQDEIVAAIQSREFDGYKIPRCSFHLNRWIRHGGWYPDYQNRLFKRNFAQWVGGEVHERVEIDGKVGVLKSDILHYVFEDMGAQIDTNNEFSSLGAKELENKEVPFSLLKLVFKPLGKFFECYVWKRGFLDGSAGFIIALGAAQSIFLKFAKLWEIQIDARGKFR